MMIILHILFDHVIFFIHLLVEEHVYFTVWVILSTAFLTSSSIIFRALRGPQRTQLYCVRTISYCLQTG